MKPLLPAGMVPPPTGFGSSSSFPAPEMGDNTPGKGFSAAGPQPATRICMWLCLWAGSWLALVIPGLAFLHPCSPPAKSPVAQGALRVAQGSCPSAHAAHGEGQGERWVWRGRRRQGKVPASPPGCERQEFGNAFAPGWCQGAGAGPLPGAPSQPENWKFPKALPAGPKTLK